MGCEPMPHLFMFSATNSPALETNLFSFTTDVHLPFEEECLERLVGLAGVGVGAQCVLDRLLAQLLKPVRALPLFHGSGPWLRMHIGSWGRRWDSV